MGGQGKADFLERRSLVIMVIVQHIMASLEFGQEIPITGQASAVIQQKGVHVNLAKGYHKNQSFHQPNSSPMIDRSCALLSFLALAALFHITELAFLLFNKGIHIHDWGK